MKKEKKSKDVESAPSENTTSIYKFVRMWHEILKDRWCHAWDIEFNFYNQWVMGETPLSSQAVFLPSGNHPLVGSPVLCGTCGLHITNPARMKTEFI